MASTEAAPRESNLATSKEKRHPIINAAYYCHGTSQRFGNDKLLSFEHTLEGLVANIFTGTVLGIDVPTYGYLTGFFVSLAMMVPNLAEFGFLRIEVTAALIAASSATDSS
jgi:hypothetical protein